MLSTKDKSQLKKLRKLVSEELKKRSLKYISVQCDYRSKKVKFIYSVYEDKGVDIKNERIIRKVQKEYYIKNVTVYDDDIFARNLSSYIDEIQRIQKGRVRIVGDDKSTLSYWIYVYINAPTRRGNIVLSPSSIRGDKGSLNHLLEYVQKHEPSMMDIWRWASDGRNFLLSYMKYKQTVHKHHRTGEGWSGVTVQSNYRRIRGFFNWLSENVEGYPPGFLNRMPFTPTPVKLTTFTPQEIEKVKNFIKENQSDKEWGWFIPMLYLMLETGVRVFELCNMKINDVEPTRRLWMFKGKGKHGGKIRSQRIPDKVWGMIKDKVVDKNGVLRIDKEYVFHREFYREYPTKKTGDKYSLVSHLDKAITTDGYRRKFKKMRDYLKLNKDLTPHACRRYFITQI